MSFAAGFRRPALAYARRIGAVGTWLRIWCDTEGMLKAIIISVALLMAFDAVLFDGDYLAALMANCIHGWHVLTSLDWRWRG